MGMEQILFEQVDNKINWRHPPHWDWRFSKDTKTLFAMTNFSQYANSCTI